MKKIVNWSILLLMALSLSACAMGGGDGPIRVKCPSCGYEFDVDRDGH